MPKFPQIDGIKIGHAAEGVMPQRQLFCIGAVLEISIRSVELC
jgi:hypothetical protein